MDVSVENGIDFFVILFIFGLGYSVINIVWLVLFFVLIFFNNIIFGIYFLVVWFLKGVFEFKFFLLRYSFIWDVSVVFEYFRFLGFLI